MTYDKAVWHINKLLVCSLASSPRPFLPKEEGLHGIDCAHALTISQIPANADKNV